MGSGGPPRLILATNIAETSITIEGVAAVIDSGLVRRPSHDPWSGLPTLTLSKIARASAEQRLASIEAECEGRHATIQAELETKKETKPERAAAIEQKLLAAQERRATAIEGARGDRDQVFSPLEEQTAQAQEALSASDTLSASRASPCQIV